MISKRILKDMGFEHIDDYFNHVLDLKSKGEKVTHLIDKLSYNQFADFIDYTVTLENRKVWAEKNKPHH